MKKIIGFTPVLLLFVTLLSSCKKDAASSASNETVPSGKSSIKCDYSGAASGNFSSSLSLSTCLKSSSLINVSGGAMSGTAVSQALLILPADIAVGTHTQGTDGTADGITFTLSINNGTQAWSVDGATATGFSVNVTRNDATGIEGTFSGQLGNDTDGTVVSLSNASFKGTF